VKPPFYISITGLQSTQPVGL